MTARASTEGREHMHRRWQRASSIRQSSLNPVRLSGLTFLLNTISGHKFKSSSML